jgi:hypothetical protein
MSNVRAIIPDAYSQRYHALSIAAALNLDYRRPEDVILAAKKLEQYLNGDERDRPQNRKSTAVAGNPGP